MLAAFRDELPWEQREIVLFGRRILQPRLIAWAGDVGYRYSGQTLEPRPFTPAARGLLARVCERTGMPFNHVLATATGVAMTAWGFTPTTNLSSAKTQWSRLCRSAYPAGSPLDLAERAYESGMMWIWAAGASSSWVKRASVTTCMACRASLGFKASGSA